jgi:RHS repeat-associated protein
LRHITEKSRYDPSVPGFQPLALSRGGSTWFYQADGLGSVTSLTGTAGAIAAGYTTDAFGNLTKTVGSLVNSFRYTGREWDSETGLYYYRARYYDPQAGRFVSEDPIGLLGGSNFYRYVGNGPTYLIDPYGTSQQDVQALINAINNAIASMTANGQRLNNGYLNNFLSGLNMMTGGLISRPYLGCGQQTDNVIEQLTPLLPQLDDSWELLPQSGFTPLYHQWGAAVSSNPNDPVIVFDPLHDNVYAVPADIWSNPPESHAIK